MTRLLLLMILLPAMLFAQTRHSEVVDSDRDAAIINLQKIAALPINNQCTKVADIRITDNGQYTTTVIFRHAVTMPDSNDIAPAGDNRRTTDRVTALSPLTVAVLNTKHIPVATIDVLNVAPSLPIADDIAPATLTSLPPVAIVTLNTDIAESKSGKLINVPPVPAVPVEALTPLPLLAVMETNTGDIPAGNAETVTNIPPLPAVLPETVVPVPAIGLAKLNITDTPIGRMGILISLPSPPPIKSEPIAPLPALAVVLLNTDIHETKTDALASFPPLPDVLSETIAPLPSLATAKLGIAAIAVAKAGTISGLPLFPDILSDEIIPVLSITIVPFNTEQVAAKTVLVKDLPPYPLVLPDAIALTTLTAAVRMTTVATPPSRVELLPAIPKFEEKRMPVAEMHLSPDGYSLLQKLEGYSPDLYSLNDGGFTIGFGFFVPYGEGTKWNKGVTWEEAEQLMQQKMQAYEGQVKRFINVPLTQNEFDALTMLAYNLGGFSKASSIVNDINSHAGFDKLQSDWKRFVHSKAPNVEKGLMNRRRDELEVRNISEYQEERKIQIFKYKK